MKTKASASIYLVLSALLPALFGAGVFSLLNFFKDKNFFNISDSTIMIISLIVLSLSVLISVLLLIKYMSHQIFLPVEHIKSELKRMSAGELKNEITMQGNAEIRELINELELLRITLLKSIDSNNKYEENRKFLLSSISHDLKTPVTSVRGYIEGILDGVANTPEKTEKYLRTAIKKTDQINFMIDDLLLYSKLDLKQIPFKCTKIEISEYIGHLAREYEQEFKNENKKVIFICETDKNTSVFIDSIRFERAFQNVADNAKKHIEPEIGCLKIIIREVSASVIIDFSDNGKGISDADLPYIFDRFYKSDTSRTSGEGSGLGLAIAKEIVEAQKGKIWAVNNKNEIGASIKISFPKI